MTVAERLDDPRLVAAGGARCATQRLVPWQPSTRLEMRESGAQRSRGTFESLLAQAHTCTLRSSIEAIGCLRSPDLPWCGCELVHEGALTTTAYRLRRCV